MTHWGIRTLGEFAALPAAEVRARLGHEGLLWQAMARGDGVELGRLKESCPRRTYSASDAAYSGRVEASLRIGTAVGATLYCQVERLNALRARAANLAYAMEPVGRLVLMAFDEGQCCGWMISPLKRRRMRAWRSTSSLS